MRKAITLTLSIALLGAFAAVVVAAVGPSDGTSTLPASSTGTTADTTTTDRTTTAPDRTTAAPDGVDVSGPCDEAEHANDPRCSGPRSERPTAPATGGADDAVVETDGDGGGQGRGRGRSGGDSGSGGSGSGSDDSGSGSDD